MSAERPAAIGHRSKLSIGPLFVFTDDGYAPGERVLFVTLRLPRLRLARAKGRARAIGGNRVRFIDWRTTAYKGASLPHRIRWAPGSPDTLIIESFRRRFRLALRLRAANEEESDYAG